MYFSSQPDENSRALAPYSDYIMKSKKKKKKITFQMPIFTYFTFLRSEILHELFLLRVH